MVVPRKPVDSLSGVPLNNGSLSPVPCPQSGPIVPNPAPAALPPPSLPYINPSPLQVRKYPSIPILLIYTINKAVETIEMPAFNYLIIITANASATVYN